MAEDSKYIRADLQQYKGASNLQINAEIKAAKSRGELIYHLAFGQSPFSVHESLNESMKRHAGENAYLNVRGTPELIESILSFHRRFPTEIPESHLQSDNVIVADGSKILIYLVMAVFDHAGVIMLQSPSWTTYRPQALLSGHSNVVLVDSNAESGWKVTAETLKQCIAENGLGPDTNKLMIFNNPGNPTGGVYNHEELKAISAVCRANNIIMISDEIYSHLVYPGTKYVSLSKYYPAGTIVTTGLSKWASAGGWRVGYAIFPPQLSAILQACSAGASHTYSCCAAPQQRAVTEFLRDHGACEEFMTHCSRVLMGVSQIVCRMLSDAGVRVVPSSAGYYIFPDFSFMRAKLHEHGITNGKQFCDRLLNEARVALLPGGPDHLRSSEEFTCRLCYINFDGDAALRYSKTVPLSEPLEMTQYCPETVAAIQAIIDWLNKF